MKQSMFLLLVALYLTIAIQVHGQIAKQNEKADYMRDKYFPYLGLNYNSCKDVLTRKGITKFEESINAAGDPIIILTGASNLDSLFFESNKCIRIYTRYNEEIPQEYSSFILRLPSTFKELISTTLWIDENTAIGFYFGIPLLGPLKEIDVGFLSDAYVKANRPSRSKK